MRKGRNLDLLFQDLNGIRHCILSSIDIPHLSELRGQGLESPLVALALSLDQARPLQLPSESLGCRLWTYSVHYKRVVVIFSGLPSDVI